jgi:hypothetical protein
MNRKQVLAAVIGVGAVTTGAAAQNAVQWRVEDGGNGHWYAVDGLTPQGLNWADAESSAVVRGAHLASITSASENTFVLNFARTVTASFHTFWIGGYRNDSNCNPPCFTWTSGEPWSFANWGPGGEPFDTWGCWGPNPNNCGWLGQGTGLAVEFSTGAAYAGLWNDETPNLIGTGAAGAPFIIEWSADCNADGIVDYGQILAGELEDTNSNGVPDCCDIGASCDPCAAADIDGNGDVNGIDLAIILDKWGTNGGKDYPNADIDGDGTIAGADLAEVLGNWGACQ